MTFKVTWTETDGTAKEDVVTDAYDALLMQKALQVSGVAQIRVLNAAGKRVAQDDLETLAMTASNANRT